MKASQSILEPSFPRSNKYSPDWILQCVSGGANSLWLAEWLSSDLGLTPGMKLLDLGCGRAASSIFLAREYGVQVWATDLWFSASENWRRVCDAQLEQQIFPIHADARNLPFAVEFFDAIVTIDALPYFGTDDHFLSYLARFVKPGGLIAAALAGFVDEIGATVPAHLAEWITAEPSLRSMHSAPWWQRHWQSSGVVDLERAESMADGWQLWLDWLNLIAPGNQIERQALEADRGRHMTYNRIVARRRLHINLDEPIASIPSSYQRADLLRHSK